MSLWGTELVPRRIDDLRELIDYNSNDPYVAADPRLGWTILPNASIGGEAPYASDERGMRILAGTRPPEGAARGPRIAAYGDSFTHCHEVPFEDCWTHLVATRLGVQVVNAGVPGYGTDQAYLRYLDTREAVRPDVVVLGLMIDDVKRNVNVFRVFLGSWTVWSKPRFLLAGEGLELINRPTLEPRLVPDAIGSGHPLLEHDWWYDPEEWRAGIPSLSVAYRFFRGRMPGLRHRVSVMRPDGEPIVLTERIVTAFAADVERDGGRFLCLIMPSRSNLRQGEPVPWQPLLTRLRRAGVEVVDPTVALRDRALSPGLFMEGGHYARSGNEIIATSLMRAIRGSRPRAEDADRAPERDTIGVYDPTKRVFYLRNFNTSGMASIVARFGPEDSIPLAGDFDGDGIDTVATYSPGSAEFSQAEVNDEVPAARRFRFGDPGARVAPLVGDWDGRDGDSVGLYAPALGRFLLRNSNSTGPPDHVVEFGPRSTDSRWIPIVGNWTGNGSIDGIGLYDRVSGQFYLKDDPTREGPEDRRFEFGPTRAELTPIVGDWDGNGVDDVGLYDPVGRRFFLRTSFAGGPADGSFRYGPAGLIPIAGNFDGH